MARRGEGDGGEGEVGGGLSGWERKDAWRSIYLVLSGDFDMMVVV